jgi:hypothetical protein
MIEIKLNRTPRIPAILSFEMMERNNGKLIYAGMDIDVTSENIEKIIQGFEKTLELLKSYANEIGVQNEKN